jgi:Ca2+-binding EF-hand superfamily protein
MDVGVAALEVAGRVASKLPIAEIRRVTGLGTFEPMEFMEVFAAATEENGTITKPTFDDCVAEISAKGGGVQTMEDEDLLRLLVGSLYGLFDTDGNGVVDFTELASGLSVLSGGTSDTKMCGLRAVQLHWGRVHHAG